MSEVSFTIKIDITCHDRKLGKQLEIRAGHIVASNVEHAARELTRMSLERTEEELKKRE